MQLGTALNLPNPRINFGGTGKVPGKGSTAIFSFETGVLDARISFSRTTNATVTNSAGVITYAPHNLLTFSEQFDNTTNWTKTQISVTANATIAPDGTTTADFIIPNTTTNQHGVNSIQQFTANTYTQTVYAKAGGYNFIILGSNQFANMFAWFNLATGQVGTKQSAIESSSITSVGNGWYRCSITSTYGGNTTYRTYSVANADNSFSFLGDGTSGVYLWGAQNEFGSTATTYNSTTVKNLLGYSELFDNAAWTKSNSFVQTNLLTYSEAFDNAAWVNVGTTESANSVTAPNGYQTADTLIDNATTGRHSIYEAYSTSALTYTFSIYAKAGTLNYVKVGIAATGTAGVYFNLATGTKGTEDAGFTGAIESVGNGWYRCSITTLLTVAANYAQVMLSTNGSDAGSYTGFGTGTVYLWGAQLVQGSVAGDYRRTDAAALPVYYPNHNGVVCAEKLVENTATSAHVITLNPTSLTTNTLYTLSIYAKAAERRYLTICEAAASASRVCFDLQTGTIAASAGGGTSSITSVGNGWYRLSLTRALVSGTSYGCSFGLSDTPTTAVPAVSYTGDGTSGIYIFGAQLSDSASLDPYVLNATAAPTAAAYYGARFDYDPVTLAPKGLLIEEQRANLFLNSSLAGTNLATQSVTVTAVPHTISFYGTGTVALTGTAIATVVGTGAYPTRTTLTFTPTVGVVLFTVTGTVQFAQLEIGAFATSFTPTAASQVTRAADVATIQGSNFYSWYNQNEGSFYANYLTEFSGVADITRYVLALDNSASKRVIYYGSGADVAACFDSSTVINSVIDTTGINAKLASAYNPSNRYIVANNNTVTSGAVVGTYSYASSLSISGVSPLCGWFKSISYYPQKLSDSVLKGLTA